MFRTVPPVHHQEFSHCTHSSDICHTGLLTACKQFHPDPDRKLSKNLYDIYRCCVYSEKTPDGGQEELSETYRALFQK